MCYRQDNSESRKVSRLLRRTTSLFVTLPLLCTTLLAADGSRISGTVSSKGTNNALQGATVRIPSLGRTVLTDSSGNFSLIELPAGPVQVVVSYSGFQDTTTTVTVGENGVAQLDVVLVPADVVAMEKFTVETIKEGQALSMTEQRNASNIKNVAAMDEWGVLPTQNVGELAMRMPGVSFAVDTDDNVVNGVSIRGMAANFTRLNIDGMSATGVGGDGRNATLYSFSGAQYEQIEIIAGQTPDKRADSIGGQLNLKTRSSLAMKEKRRISYNLSGRWAPPFSDRTDLRGDHPLHPSGSISYQEIFDVFGGKRNLGISATASYTENVNPIANNTLLYRNDTASPAPFVDYADFYGINHRGVTGLLLKSDLRYADEQTITFSLLYNVGAEPYYKRTKINPFSGNTVTATLDSSGAATGTGAIMPGYSENTTNVRAVSGSVMSLETDSWSFYSKNPTASVVGENNFGRLKLNYAGRYSYTHWDSGSGRENEGGALYLRTVTPIAFTLDKSNLDGRVFTQTGGPSVYDAANYIPTTASTNWRFDRRKTLADTTEVSARLDATYNFTTTVPITLKSGFDYSDRTVDQGKGKDRRWLRKVGAPALTGALMPITRFEQVHGGNRLPVFDPDDIGKTLSDTSLWTEDYDYSAQRPYISRRKLIETVPATYVQGQTRLWKVTLLTGVRAEHVETEAFTYFKRLSTTVAEEPDAVKRAARDYQGVTRKGSYTKYFPSAHLVYDITANLKARASWSTSYGRPTIQQLIPTPSVNETAQTVTAGNPELKPQLAENFDLKLEYYFKSTGLVSIGYFQKRIKDYISPTGALIGEVADGPNNGFGGLYGGYDIIAFYNMGSATVDGLEFDYRQRLTFLPSFLKGFTLAANYTTLSTEGKFNGTVDLSGRDVPGFIPRTGNARLLYNYKRFGASTAVNYTSDYIVSYTAIGSTANYYRKKLITTDAGVTYKIRPEVTGYINVSNLFEEGPETYRYISSRTRSITNGAMTVSIGVTGQF